MTDNDETLVLFFSYFSEKRQRGSRIPQEMYKSGFLGFSAPDTVLKTKISTLFSVSDFW